MSEFHAYVAATGRYIGRFVADRYEDACDMLARRFGHASTPTDWRWRASYRLTTATSRAVKTHVNAILELVMLTEEDEGTTGHMVRSSFYEMLGRVTDEDLLAFVNYYTSDSEDEDERRHVQRKLLPLIDAMRIDALEDRLSGLGLDRVGHDVMRARWDAVPTVIATVMGELRKRKRTEANEAVRADIDEAMAAATEVLEGRKGWRSE